MKTKDLDVPAILARLGVEVRKTAGRELWAACPLHAVGGRPERTPSFRVRNDPGDEKHGFWQCFGSCEGERRNGGILKLVRLLLDLPDAKSARRWIRDEHVEREPEPPPRLVRVEGPTPTLSSRGIPTPKGVVVAPVATWPTPARRYLVETRGVPAEQADRWGLGYACAGRYAGRVYLPAHDRRMHLVNYTARSFTGDPLKFKEPPEGSGADKGAVFGERFWPAPSERRVVVALESALNALAVERAAPEFCVGAIFGSEVLPAHLLKFGTFPLVLVASDPDKAGEKYWRAIRGGLARHAWVERVDIPDGTDCADLGRDAPDILRRNILEAAERAGAAGLALNVSR
jgi:DNA primase